MLLRREAALPSTNLTSSSLLVCAWILLAIALQLSNGVFDEAGLVCLTLSWLAALAAIWRKSLGASEQDDTIEKQLAFALAIALALGFIAPSGLFVKGAWYDQAWRLGALPLLALTCAEWLGKSDKRIFAALFAYGVIFALAMRALMLIASPHPMIDVFPMFQESAQHLFAGQNPYQTAVSDAYAGRQDMAFGYKIFGYAYLPLNLLIEAPFWRIFGDIRAAHIACEAAAALAMFYAGRGSIRARRAILLFFFMPRGLFVIEQAWTEPMIVAAFAWAAAASERHPGSRGAALAYGLMLSLKQYLVFFILHGLMIERRPRRIALAAAAGAATLLPFLIWDWRSLYDYGVLFQLKTPFRPDALTLSSALYAATGIEIGKAFSASVGLAVASLCFVALRRFGAAGWRLSAIATTFSIFLFGSQGFANYYYFIAAMMALHLAIGPSAQQEASVALAPQAAE